MATRLTRRDLLGGAAASGALLALGTGYVSWPAFERRTGRVLIVEEGSFANYPTPLGARLAAQGFKVWTTDLAEEGIDLGRLYDFDAVILGPHLPAQDRARLQLAFRMAKIPTPVLAA
jgi:hypothetical protein